MKPAALIAFLVVLLGGIALVVAGTLRTPARIFHQPLKTLLPEPAQLASWRAEEKPIADTPEMKEAVGELLNFDDGIFMVYTRGSRRISVYIAYWTPGRMSHRIVASHTPDVCWVGGGWRRLESGASTLPVDAGRTTQVGEFRVFTLLGTVEHVVFWHLVGSKPKSYGVEDKPPWWAPLMDMWDKGLDQREEQFFVRISSNEPISLAWREPWLRELAASVPGLVAPTPSEVLATVR